MKWVVLDKFGKNIAVFKHFKLRLYICNEFQRKGIQKKLFNL